MFLVVKKAKKNPLRLRNGFSSKYGEGGIRTLDTGINPYNGLANRRFYLFCYCLFSNNIHIITKF